MSTDQHHEGTTYEGRALARPEEELADQGFGFDVVTLMNRRRLLRTLGLGAAALSLAACTNGNTSGSAGSPSAFAPAGAAGSSAAASGEIPDETAGPYPGDGSNGPDVLEQSGIVRSDIRPASAARPAPPRGCR
jgi:hypothetical protein